MFAVDTNIWRYQVHPEVWIVVLGAIGLALYATRVIGPKMVPAGTSPTTPKNRRAFIAGIFMLWLASDWPMHDISEEYLYFVHMIQHLIITFIVPPLLLLAVPEWLGRLLISPEGNAGTAGTWIRRLSRPVAAGFLFNLGVAITHTSDVVNTSVANGPFHYAVHFVVFTTALLMWVPVVGPLPELRISPPAKMIYLFMMSILPTVPAAFLTFTREPLYSAYNHPVRLWGITVVQDQQAAGVVMKLAGGMYLWALIGVIFFRWAKSDRDLSRPMRRVNSGSEATLTYEDVQEAFDSTDPAPDRLRS